uniref:glycine rich domain-containing protein n=1 Tax=Odoribacter lunatus TaxID=2941335 RepID=UPI00203A3D3D
YVKKPGEAKFDIIPDANGESLVYNNFVNTGTTFVRYQFKRVAICAVGMAETVTNVYVAPLPWTISLDTYTNVYPSFTVNSTWANMTRTHWKLDNAPAGISIAADKGVVSGLTSNSVFWVDVTVSSDKCPGQSWTKKLEITRQFNYTGGVQSIVLTAGKYKMECWGASGTSSSSYVGGRGGYVKGELYLTVQKNFYIYVGEIGVDKSVTLAYGVNSFNGGGGGSYTCYNYNKGKKAYNYMGGGATDIRLTNGAWNDFNSLKSRIMVAAGGAAAPKKYQDGVPGGGLKGYDGPAGNGGTQTSAGGSNGGFGYGGTAAYGGGGCNNNDAYGAGSGYYGGGASDKNYLNMGNYTKSAGSGSSFISGHTGCDAISASSTSSNIIHTGQSIHYSGVYFTNTIMIDGAGYQWTTAKGSYIGMPNLAGTGTMTGNSGNGQVRITPLN